MNALGFYMSCGAICGTVAFAAECALTKRNERDFAIPLIAFLFWLIALVVFVVAFTEDL